MIQVSGLSHDFVLGKKNQRTTLSVLKDITLQVEKGEIVTVVGKSGSGKSTLLNLISGFIRPTKGDIRIDGNHVSDFSESAFADLRLNKMGFVFQNFQLLPAMTAFQNVELPLTLSGMNTKRRRQLAGEMMEKVGLSEYQEHYPSELSGGQQQRVSIARAMVLNPPLIMAD